MDAKMKSETTRAQYIVHTVLSHSTKNPLFPYSIVSDFLKDYLSA